MGANQADAPYAMRIVELVGKVIHADGGDINALCDDVISILTDHRHEARKAALEEAAGIADDQAVRAWEIGEAEGQNAVCSSGRNHGARAIAIAIRSAIGGETPSA